MAVLERTPGPCFLVRHHSLVGHALPPSCGRGSWVADTPVAVDSPPNTLRQTAARYAAGLFRPWMRRIASTTTGSPNSTRAQSTNPSLYPPRLVRYLTSGFRATSL